MTGDSAAHASRYHRQGKYFCFQCTARCGRVNGSSVVWPQRVKGPNPAPLVRLCPTYILPAQQKCMEAYTVLVTLLYRHYLARCELEIGGWPVLSPLVATRGMYPPPKKESQDWPFTQSCIKMNGPFWGRVGNSWGTQPSVYPLLVFAPISTCAPLKARLA